MHGINSTCYKIYIKFEYISHILKKAYQITEYFFPKKQGGKSVHREIRADSCVIFNHYKGY